MRHLSRRWSLAVVPPVPVVELVPLLVEACAAIPPVAVLVAPPSRRSPWSTPSSTPAPPAQPRSPGGRLAGEVEPAEDGGAGARPNRERHQGQSVLERVLHRLLMAAETVGRVK